MWRMDLDVAPWAKNRLYATLSQDELDRADRFRFDMHRLHFVAARGSLRSILAEYTRADPTRLQFHYSTYGKPSLVAFRGCRDIRFNMSHSGGMALVAVTEGREIGIDVEQIRTEIDTEAVAERFFSPAERDDLRNVPQDSRCQSFYACWTRKEAYIKAVGQGLSLALDSFDVALTPGARVGILATRPAAREASRWTLKDLEVEPEYAAALAVEGPVGLLKGWYFSLESGKQV